jgi:hypothetical protein
MCSVASSTVAVAAAVAGTTLPRDPVPLGKAVKGEPAINRDHSVSGLPILLAPVAQPNPSAPKSTADKILSGRTAVPLGAAVLVVIFAPVAAPVLVAGAIIGGAAGAVGTITSNPNADAAQIIGGTLEGAATGAIAAAIPGGAGAGAAVGAAVGGGTEAESEWENGNGYSAGKIIGNILIGGATL